MLAKNKAFWDDSVRFPKPFEGEVLAPVNVPEGFGFVEAPMEVDPDSYSNLDAVQRLRYRIKLADQHELRALLETAIHKFKEAGLEDDAFVVKQLKKIPGELAAKLRPAIENPELLEQNEPLSPAQALAMLLDIVAKPHTRGGAQPVNSTKEKFEVTTSNVAYLAALVSVSDEVRNKCHVRHTFADVMPDSPTFDSFVVDTHLKKSNQHQNPSANSNSLHYIINMRIQIYLCILS